MNLHVWVALALLNALPACSGARGAADLAQDVGDLAGDRSGPDGDGDAADGEGAGDADTPDRDDGPPAPGCDRMAARVLADAKLPAGYCAWTWAEGLDEPRGLAVAPGGDLLVVERGAGRVTALHDGDGDGVSGPGERAVLARAAGLNHGVAVHGGWLYASSDTTVWRWPYAAGDRKDLGAGRVVVRNVPEGGHVTRTLGFDAQGRLYVSVGSGRNVDPNPDRALIYRYSLASVPADGIEASTGEVFALGLRNEVGLAFDGTGRLWGVENGRDNLSRDDLGGDIHQDNPSEELNLFAEPGRFYGYPYCFSEFLLPEGVGKGPGTEWADPGFRDDGTHTDAWCQDPANVRPPALALPAHNAPLGIAFYDGGLFPADARGDAFVAMHGSWNADPPTGYNVTRVFFQGGSAPVRFEAFLAYRGPGSRGPGWPHRPVDVRVGPGGILLVSSDASGVILAVGR